jgi:hypothetical protein
MGCFLSLNKGLAEWRMLAIRSAAGTGPTEYNEDGNNTVRRGETGSVDSIRNAGTWI